MDNTSIVKEFMAKYFDVTKITEETNIFESGFVNSLFAMQLVTFLEKEFDILIDNEELDLENFKNINAIVKLIERKS